MRKNDKAVIAVAAQAAGLPPSEFFVEESHGAIVVNHPDSMKWSREKRQAVEAAVKQATSMSAAVT